jgi:hypothetical protein
VCLEVSHTLQRDACSSCQGSALTTPQPDAMCAILGAAPQSGPTLTVRGWSPSDRKASHGGDALVFCPAAWHMESCSTLFNSVDLVSQRALPPPRAHPVPHVTNASSDPYIFLILPSPHPPQPQSQCNAPADHALTATPPPSTQPLRVRQEPWLYAGGLQTILRHMQATGMGRIRLSR